MSTPYAAILSQFATDHLEEFEHAIETLKASFSRSFNGFSNPLPSLLELDSATIGRIAIPILDQNRNSFMT